MAVFIVTGKLGAGKSLYSAWRIYRYLTVGRKVACNFDLNIEKRKDLPNAEVWRLPSVPRIEDLKALGRGGPSEEKAGLLCLDECGMFLNSRNWADKERQEVINWMLHSRKLGWDIILIVQSVSAIDKQIREMIGEHLVSLSRLDRLKIPILGIGLPRIHMAAIRYGLNTQNPPIERQMFRGSKELFDLYDTGHIFEVETKPLFRLPFYVPKPKQYPKWLADLLAFRPYYLIPFLLLIAYPAYWISKALGWRTDPLTENEIYGRQTNR